MTIVIGRVAPAALLIGLLLAGCATPIPGAPSGPSASDTGSAGQTPETAEPSGGPLDPTAGQPAGSGGEDAAGDPNGPPTWVEPGMRLTFYAGAASVAQSRFAWVEDPNGPWLDPATGKRYRRTDAPGGGGAPSASGEGVVQFDVLAVDQDTVTVAQSMFARDFSSGKWLPMSTLGDVVTGGVLDGAWANPALLADLAAAPPDGLQVLFGPYPLGEKTYDAVSFVSSGTGAYQSYTYDTATGLLLAATTRTDGATSPISTQGESAPKGNTQLTATFFAGARQRAVPGMGGVNPSWVAGTDQIAFRGDYTFVNPVDPASANLTFPMSLTISLQHDGSEYLRYRSAAVVDMPGGQQSEAAGVTGPTGPHWYDPAALEGLSAGQLLDTDPLTGERTVVAASDADSVSISVTMPGLSNLLHYDRATGALLRFVQSQELTGVTMDLWRQ